MGNIFSPLWKAFVNSPVLCPSCNTFHFNLDHVDYSVGSLLNFESYHVLIQCVILILSYFTYMVALERLLPYTLATPNNYVKNDKANGKLSYRINGHLSFWITIFLVDTVGWPFYDGELNMYQFSGRSAYVYKFIYANYSELAFVTSGLCLLLSVYMYVASFLPSGKVLADGGNTGNVMYDFFMGRELNPRLPALLPNFDWKEFCELRPGLIGWVVINMSCAYMQHETLGYVSGSMVLINVFQGLYV